MIYIAMQVLYIFFFSILSLHINKLFFFIIIIIIFIFSHYNCILQKHIHNNYIFYRHVQHAHWIITAYTYKKYRSIHRILAGVGNPNYAF